MDKTPDQIYREIQSRNGKAGNKKLRSLYSKKQLREWAKKGGRPRKKSGDNSSIVKLAS